MEDFDIISLRDKPALLAISSLGARTAVKTTLANMGYKVHAVDEQSEFEKRYSQIPYQVVMIEENFGGSTLAANPVLRLIQNLPMNLRRNAVFFLIGASVETLNTLQAFSLSVHCVINYAQLARLAELVQNKTTAENDLFLTPYRDIGGRLHQKA